jgi:membrane protein
MPGMKSVAQGRRRSESPSILRAAGLLVGVAVLRAFLAPSHQEMESRPFGAKEPPKPLAVQHRRATESGRGRRALSPWQIPWRGWKDILWRTYVQIQDDRLFAISAGVVFFALLALFPAITAIVSMYGLFADLATIEGHIALVSGFAPEQAVSVVREQIERLIARGNTELGFGFIIGVGIAIWSANAGLKAIIDALNVVYEEAEKRSFLKLNLISLTLTAGAVTAVLLGIGAVVVVPILFEHVGLGAATEWLFKYGRWPILVVVMLLGLAILYRYGPSRERARWQWLSAGSVAAAVFWLAGSAAFSFYIQNFANYDATYGSLGTGIGLMMWMWLSVIAVLFGGELNAEIEHQTSMDSTTDRPQPIGRRGAAMADTVGAAQS